MNKPPVSRSGNGLTSSTIDSRIRRNLPGMRERGRAPTKPLEVLAVTHDGIDHAVKKQTGALCVNGIDQWRVETACGVALVVTQGAVTPRCTTCLVCLMEGG